MKKKKNKKRLLLKIVICIFYLIVIVFLAISSFLLYKQKMYISPWSLVKSTNDYSYIDIYKMSEKFAYFEESDVGIHFVIEKEDTGLWHTYLIAIDEKKYDDFKKIIDYTYERTNEVPDVIRVYGYPVIVSDELKKMAINKISSFLPKENEIVINDENYEDYLTNCYLDTTVERTDQFSILLCVCLFLLVIVFVLLLFTLFDKKKTDDIIM